VNVALASISQTLKATRTSLEMTAAIYGVVFAVCLAMPGRLGDNFGRRRWFGIGVAVFAVAYQSARLRCFASNVAHHLRDPRGEG
jgi:MFS family permease